MRKWLWAVIRNGCRRAVREDSRNFCTSAQVRRFGRDSRSKLNKIFGALAANIGSADGGLSSIAVRSLHGCNGSSFHVVVLMINGFTGGFLCGAGLVLCFWITSAIRNGRRTAATAEAVSVCVGHKMIAVRKQGSFTRDRF